MSRKLLVTGGTGFIGSHLAENALRQGHEVSVLGLTELESDAANASMLRSMGAQVHSGSITDVALCKEAMNGVTHVYHLAVAMREAGVSDSVFEEINREGTRNLLDLAVRQSIKRFVYCGTIGVFGHRVNGVVDETSPTAPGNIYEKTKLAAEKLALEYSRDHGLPVVALRPADVYGPRDQRLLKLFKAIAKGRFPLFGDGAGRRHMVYVDDVVAAFERASESDDAIGEVMIIAGPEVCTLRQLLDTIAAVYGQTRFGFRLPLWPMLLAAAVVEDVCTKFSWTPPLYRRRMDFFTSDSEFNIERAKTTMGWEPRVGLLDGVNRTLAAYQSQID